MSEPGIDWQMRVAEFGDGDTVRAHLVGIPTPVGHLLGQATVTTGKRGAPLRPIGYDTPEGGEPGYDLSKRQFAEWLIEREDFLRVTTYGFDSFGRYLSNIYDSRNNQNVTYYMLGLGYPIWKKR